jgi:hypothetical protein
LFLHFLFPFLFSSSLLSSSIVSRCMLLSAVSSRPPHIVFLPMPKCILLVPYEPHPKTLWHRAKARNSGLSDDMDSLSLKALLFLLP